MSLRIVFFGNSGSVFSNRHFAVLPSEAVVGVVDSPSYQRGTTTAHDPDHAPFVDIAQAPVFAPDTHPNLIENLRTLQPDLFIAIGYTRLLKADALSLPRLLAANFHASLLPAYRGLHPVFYALRAGEKWAGLTVHVMDTHLDTGDILYQVRVETRPDDSVNSLYERIMQASVTLIPRLLRDAEKGSIPRQPQDTRGASYFSKTDDADFRLEWAWTAEKLARWVTITPGKCFFETRGERVYVLDATIVKGEGQPGAIIELDAGIIATGENALQIGQVRSASGDELSLAEYCRQKGIMHL